MGLRFQKRITIFPGVTINLSKSGASLSLGPRGAKYTISSKGHRGTVGIPGTGVSYTKYKSHKDVAKDIGSLSGKSGTSDNDDTNASNETDYTYVKKGPLTIERVLLIISMIVFIIFLGCAAFKMIAPYLQGAV